MRALSYRGRTWPVKNSRPTSPPRVVTVSPRSFSYGGRSVHAPATTRRRRPRNLSRTAVEGFRRRGRGSAQHVAAWSRKASPGASPWGQEAPLPASCGAGVKGRGPALSKLVSGFDGVGWHYVVCFLDFKQSRFDHYTRYDARMSLYVGRAARQVPGVSMADEHEDTGNSAQRLGALGAHSG